MKTIRIGTRGSRLALWQARWVKEALEKTGAAAETVVIHTTGDRSASDPIARLGATGVFTKEIQRALLDGEVDLAVHSMKDLPTETPERLTLAAVPVRADVRDVLVGGAETLDALPDGARIGTGSLRRKCQLLNRFDSRIIVEEIRGNVETRLAKLDAGEYDAILLAVAGLRRLGFSERIRPEAILAPEEIFPAVGQGALAIEARRDDAETLSIAGRLDDFETRQAVLAERAMLRTLEGGCIAPIGAFSSIEDGRLTLQGRILSLDGRKRFDAVDSAPLSDAESLGRSVADKLAELGAGEILEELRRRREA